MNTAIAAVLLAPRNAAVLVLRGYRAVISPLYYEFRNSMCSGFAPAFALSSIMFFVSCTQRCLLLV